MTDFVLGNNGTTKITLTNGQQRKSKRAGISYDFMDKLNQYVKQGIFIDKDNNGFTKQERAALGKEFTLLHSERGDITNFRKMKAGASFDYIDEEFIRLAKAAGYVLADENKTLETPKTNEVETPQQVVQPESNRPVEKPKENEVSQQQNTQTTKPKDEVETVYAELQEMMTSWENDKEFQETMPNWSKEDRQFLYAKRKLDTMQSQLKAEIKELENGQVTEEVTKRRWLRRDKTETIVRDKTQEEKTADLKKANEKRKELTKLSKMAAVCELYSSKGPGKYAIGKNDRVISHIITTKDGRKLGVAIEKRVVHDKNLGDYEKYVDVYYPISLSDMNAGDKTQEFPHYYYRVLNTAQPVDYTE